MNIQNINSQFQSLLDSKLSPISTKLSQISDRITLINNPKTISFKKQCVSNVCKKIPKIYEIMFVKLLENVLKGIRYYKAQHTQAETEYRIVRMKSYYLIIQTINSLDSNFKKHKLNNIHDIIQAVDIVMFELIQSQMVIEKAEDQVMTAMLNLHQFIAQQSYTMYKEMEEKQQHPEWMEFQNMINQMPDDDFLSFLAHNTKDQQLIKFAQARRRGEQYVIMKM